MTGSRLDNDIPVVLVLAAADNGVNRGAESLGAESLGVESLGVDAGASEGGTDCLR